MNNFIIKKTIGGPKRFRPKSREELENELKELEIKYKRVVAQVSSLTKKSESMPQVSKKESSQESKMREKEEDDDADINSSGKSTPLNNESTSLTSFFH